MRCRFSKLLVAVLLSAPAFAFSDPASSTQQGQSAQIQTARTVQTIEQATSGDTQLPLLSILGMGLLTGGLLSAMRTRPR